MIQPMSVSAIERDPAGVTVTLADGEKISRAFAGRRRWAAFVRARRVGIRTIGWDYPVTAIVATIATREAARRGGA
jgi:2-octaprenyl-6-methoxyphenol hydroxylase